jgi:hypothetical protein
VRAHHSNLSAGREIVCLLMVLVLPLSLVAQDSAGAILHSNDGVLLNKNPAPTTSALFYNDLIETPQNAVARIEAAGSTVDINPQTLVEFEDGELVLDHGMLSVNTSRGLRVRVGCLTVTPANPQDWTHYEVADTDGKVTVSALKSDANIDSHYREARANKQPSQSDHVTVREGERKSRSEKCGAGDLSQSARVPGLDAILNSGWARAGGMIAVGVITCFALCRSDTNPVSPWEP